MYVQFQDDQGNIVNVKPLSKQQFHQSGTFGAITGINNAVASNIVHESYLGFGN
jgi:hypothetical protein